MEHKKIKISEINPAEYNPRKISEKDFNNLKKSVETYGVLRPFIINRKTGNLISGHQLLKVLQEKKIEEADAIFLDLSDEQEKALNLAMNKISGEFEEDKLIELLQQIDEKNQDLLGQTGFNTEEINYLLGLRERDKEDIFAASLEDEFKLETNKYGIESGDIVQIDGHKIICGDSTDPDNFKKIIGDKKIDLVVTSPPYNLDIPYGKYQDNRDFKDYINMIEKVFLNSYDFLEKGRENRFICINIGREWGPINMPAKYDSLLEQIGFKFFRNVYWNKPLGGARGNSARNPFPRLYKPKVQTEIIQIYSTEEMPELKEHMILYQTGAGEKRRDEQIPEILLTKYAGNVWSINPQGMTSEGHPAIFPVQLPFNCIRFFSFEGESVIDPFMGSGSTLIAADQLNRKCYGIELDPLYVCVAIDRYLIYKPNAKFEIIKSNEEKVL